MVRLIESTSGRPSTRGFQPKCQTRASSSPAIRRLDPVMLTCVRTLDVYGNTVQLKDKKIGERTMTPHTAMGKESRKERLEARLTQSRRSILSTQLGSGEHQFLISLF